MIKDDDSRYRRLLAELSPRAIRVGVRNLPEGRGVTTVQVGTWQEYGTRRRPAEGQAQGPQHIPPRPFISGWFDEYEQQNREILKSYLGQVVGGKITSKQMLSRLGVLFVAQAQMRISAGLSPENAASTIARKGSSKPLINRGVLRSSIGYEVE